MPTWPELLWFLVTIFSDSLHDLNASCTCIHGPVRPHNFQNARYSTDHPPTEVLGWTTSSMEKKCSKRLISLRDPWDRDVGIGKISQHEEALMSEELTLVIAGEANNHLDDALSKRSIEPISIAKKRGNDEWRS